MKKNLSEVSMVAVMFFLTGCPYESSVTIDNPSVKINTKLLGVWKDKKNSDIYTVEKHDEFTYSITQSKDNDKLLAFVSIVNGVNFLNFWTPGSDEPSKKYSFYKMEMQTDGSILLSEITDNIKESFTSSDEWKKFISANMKNSYFFGKETITLVRN